MRFNVCLDIVFPIFDWFDAPCLMASFSFRVKIVRRRRENLWRPTESGESVFAAKTRRESATSGSH